MITGASEGIGREMALELAKSGFNLVIASRSQEKLKDAAAYIKGIVPDCVIDIKPIDFGKGEPTDLKQFFNESIQNRNLKLLINNVGYFQRR